MDEHAEGAHRGMTLQMEHTPCKDPMTDEAAVVSEFGLHSPVFSCIWIEKLPFYASMYPTCNSNLHIIIWFEIDVKMFGRRV